MQEVSIITVVYNNEIEIEKTIQNVLKQTYESLEYIVVDGASSDGTLEIIKKYSHRLKYISEPDKGIYDAMMKGVNMASGEWLLFRNCGDYFISPTAIEDVFSHYTDNNEDFILTNSRFFKEWGFCDMKPSILNAHYLDSMPVIHPSTFIRRNTQLKYPFQLKYKNSADYCFFIEAFSKGATFCYFDVLLALMDCRKGTTADYYERTLRDNIKIMRQYGAPASRIRKLRKVLCKTIIAKIIIYIFPSFKHYFIKNELHRGWVKCPLNMILKDV